MTPSITLATSKDVPDLHKMIGLLCAFHGDTNAMGLADVQTQIIASDRLTAFIAKEGDSAIGYAVLEKRWRPMNESDALDIAHLYVKETKRNQGIGRALINAATGYARNQNACRLTIGTAPDNAGAAAAYRAMGLNERTAPIGPQFQIPL